MQSGDHNHVPLASECEVIRAKHSLREDATASRDATRNVVARSLNTLLQDAAAEMLSVDAMRQSVHHRRHLTRATPTAPTSLNSLLIPDAFKQMTNGRRFLLHDCGAGADRIIIYATEANLEEMVDSRHWFMDGIFKTMPLLFAQVYMIHILKQGHTIPLVFASDKTAATYERLFHFLLANKPELDSAFVVINFKAAARQAVSRVFPNVLIQGCLFHLGQSVWQRIQNDGLQQRYSADADFALQLRLLLALAFVPVADMETAFDCVTSNFPAEGNSVLDYFEF